MCCQPISVLLKLVDNTNMFECIPLICLSTNFRRTDFVDFAKWWLIHQNGGHTKIILSFSFESKVKFDFQVKSVVQGNGELFNASFYQKAQDHFRATKPGAGNMCDQRFVE